MDYNFTKSLKSQAEIDVSIPFREFEPHLARAATLISEETEIEGFRRGKAPYEIVKQKFGENAIYERAADLAVRKTYPELMQKMLDSGEVSPSRPPIGRPEITIIKLVPGNDLEFKIRLAVMPEVKLSDYKVIARRVQKEKKAVSITDEEVEKTLEWLRESRAPLITVDRPAQSGDTVEIDFSARGGSASGGEVKDNSPILSESKNHPLVIGQGKFLPGFEDNLIGMKVGDEKSFTLVAPENWHEKSMAGKAFDFIVTMKLVQERKLPELTDESVKNLGDFPSVEALKKSIREGIGKEKEEKEIQRLRALTIEKIAEETKIEVPDVLIEGELDKMFTELKSGVEQMGMKWEDYLLHIKKGVEELQKDWRDEAEKRVRIALVLREIAKVEKIEPTAEEIETRANQLLSQYKSVEDAKKHIDAEELKEYTKGILKNQKVFEFLEKM
ncbi:MAG: trigger factor [Candidatus Sungiibacteriota bacterium]|uniref:Trigger factor n=1 Tax=Candidatus Sungiibacteriota bacterium TaxID=2750080 RepID=A0A7T5UQY6_9BACT|nr:MAG: trigger factor [Candidatus Sungbacteria bacterium]